MTPVSSKELQRFAAGTFSRVPAFMIGRDMAPGTTDGRVLSQSVLLPSYEWWLSGTTTLGPHDAVMLDGSDTMKCSFHARGDRRGLLEFICPEGDGEVRMQGDHTRFVRETGFGGQRRRSILDTIARERLADLHRAQRSAQKPAD